MKWTPLIFLFFLIAAACIYPFLATHNFAIWFGAAAQITALVLAGYNTSLARDAYGRTDEPRSAWLSITIGLWIWVIAQFLESGCDLVLKTISYGTIADAFWFVGYFPMTVGVWRLVQSYRKTGLPLGSRTSYIAQIAALTVLFGLVFYNYILGQVLDPDRPVLIKFLDVSYPGMDFVLVCLTSVLIRFAWLMRGGALARSWILLCLGFTLVGVADLWLSYSTEFESAFYRLDDLVYFSSYFIIALAGMYQVRMLKSA